MSGLTLVSISGLTLVGLTSAGRLTSMSGFLLTSTSFGRLFGDATSLGRAWLTSGFTGLPVSNSLLVLSTAGRLGLSISGFAVLVVSISGFLFGPVISGLLARSISGLLVFITSSSGFLLGLGIS